MTVTADPQGGTAVTRSNTMSLTYSDFLYARNDSGSDFNEDEGSRQERRSLPSDFRPIQETKVPLMQNADAVNNDFILICEFSELQGPIPLCTIPNDAPEKSDIKINDFVVHLMSTDYQVNTVGQFRICQDTQVMRKNVFPDVHVFMQYFTLYDIKARGFVRPFCLGYVSKDHIKLDKYLTFLISEFGKVTSVLEQCNRQGFSRDLKMYLHKLQSAKDNYIRECSSGVGDDNQDDELDPDTVTLAQIAHQYSEIGNILTIVENFESPHPHLTKDIGDITLFAERYGDSGLVAFLRKNEIFSASGKGCSSDASFESLNIPLVHPLRSKGEPLRPITVLGQLGSVYLVGKLMQIYNSCKTDIIFTEMTESSLSFRQHFENLRLQRANTNTGRDTTSSPGKSSGISADFDNSSSSNSAADCSFSDDSRMSAELSPFEVIQERGILNSGLWYNLKNKELFQLIEKLHASSPLITDNKSGSYHTVSEEESDVNIPTPLDAGTEVESCGVSAGIQDAAMNNGRVLEGREENSVSSRKNRVDSVLSEGGTDNRQLNSYKLRSLHSFSSDEEMSMGSSSLSQESNEEVIVKEPWWMYASKKLVRGVPGYGLANFFRRYHEAAHHVLYSILLGRPIIICGEEKFSRKIVRIITALIPLVPAVTANSNRTSWKLLRWHRGILVQTHIDSYRLIGLCIPEKLEVHDLIPPRLVTLVTILNAEKKCILGGPAYSGDFLQGFEKKYQKHFYNSDVSLLTYIGGLYAEIESKVFMYKSLVDKHKGKSNSSTNTIHLLFKELNMRASDVEIVKYLGQLISDPSDCVSIF